MVSSPSAVDLRSAGQPLRRRTRWTSAEPHLAGLLAAALVTAALWFSHMPSLLLHAQLYADDGGWYQVAYTLGPVASLPHPANGYFDLLQRLTASISLALPLIAVPTFFNVVALVVELAGVGYLLSSRMAGAIPSLAARLSIAVLVIALPNAYDTSGNLTNAQWHLALLAFLVLFAGPPRRLAGHLLDAGVLLLSGLSGPYCIILEPIALWTWLRHRADQRRRNLLLLNSTAVLIQMVAISTTVGAQRTWGELGAGFLPLARMLGRQLSIGLLAGAHGLNHLAATPLGSSPFALVPLAAVPLLVCAWAAWRGPLMLRAFCGYAALELALALLAPSIPAPQWQSLGNPAGITNFHPGGIRYFLYPLLAFAVSLGWIAWRYGWRTRPWARRRMAPHRPAPATILGWVAGVLAAGALAVAAGFGARMDWLYPPYLDLHWPAQVQRFEAAPPGRTVVIPVNPQGWSLTLVAR